MARTGDGVHCNCVNQRIRSTASDDLILESFGLGMDHLSRLVNPVPVSSSVSGYASEVL